MGRRPVQTALMQARVCARGGQFDSSLHNRKLLTMGPPVVVAAAAPPPAIQFTEDQFAQARKHVALIKTIRARHKQILDTATARENARQLAKNEEEFKGVRKEDEQAGWLRREQMYAEQEEAERLELVQLRAEEDASRAALDVVTGSFELSDLLLKQLFEKLKNPGS